MSPTPDTLDETLPLCQERSSERQQLEPHRNEDDSDSEGRIINDKIMKATYCL